MTICEHRRRHPRWRADHVRDVAEVELGNELRTGAATQNGEEVVLGTVFMLVGENSRAVARAVAPRDSRDQSHACPTGVVARPSTTAPNWWIAPSTRCTTTCSKARCWSSPCCSCSSATCARH